MTASDHLRITGPEDILGFIPHSLGYWPENSLVAMTMQGKRLGATLRVDLPDPGGASGTCRNVSGRSDPAAGRARAVAKRRPGSGRRDTLAGFARHVVSYLQADDAADGSLLAFFTDADSISGGVNGAPTDPDNAREGPRAVWAGLLKELELALQAAGIPLRDAWIIGTEFWQNAYCSDPECCGPPGRPVEQIRNSRLNAEMVFRGSMVGAAPDARASAPVSKSVDPAEHAAVQAAESGWMTQFSPRQRDRAQFAQVLDIWTLVLRTVEDPERSLGLRPDAPTSATGSRDTGTHDAGTTSAGAPDAKAGDWPFNLPPELAGYLRASLCIPPWRDALLVMAAAGRPAAERGAEDFGIFEADCGPGTLAVPRPGPTPSPLPGSAAGSLSSSMPGTLSSPMSGTGTLSGVAPEPTSAAAGPGPGPGPGRGPGPGADPVPGYGEVLLGLAPSIPDWALMVRLERVLELLGALGDGEPTAAAVTARGWIEWCRGRGSYADALYRQALEGHPGYRLAELLAELGRRGTLCGWAARREAAWQKFAPDAA